MKSKWSKNGAWIAFAGLFLAIASSLPAQPATEPATQPATAPAAAGRAREAVRRLREAAEQLDLSDDQKAQTQKVINEMQRRLRALAREAQGDVEQVRAKTREIFNDARQELIEVLTPEQQQKLRDLLADAINPPRMEPRPRTDSPPRMDSPPPPRPREQMDDQPDEPQRAPQGGERDGRQSTVPAIHPLVNAPAPDFTLTKLDGRNVQLASFKGKILVLLFGNYSSPTFRDRADDYETLRRQYANRAEFLIIYTRESHPTGGWEVERNKEAKVAVEQPADEAARKELAQQARQTLKLTIPIAPDTMDDKTTTAYDGFTTCAVIIGRDGTILAHRKWADRYTLSRLIDEAIGG